MYICLIAVSSNAPSVRVSWRRYISKSSCWLTVLLLTGVNAEALWRHRRRHRLALGEAVRQTLVLQFCVVLDTVPSAPALRASAAFNPEEPRLGQGQWGTVILGHVIATWMTNSTDDVTPSLSQSRVWQRRHCQALVLICTFCFKLGLHLGVQMNCWSAGKLV